MKTAVINFKTDVQTKEMAKKVAEDLGFSLGSLMNGYLHNLIKKREVNFSLNEKLEPSNELVQALKEAGEDIKKGNISPGFKNSKDAINWLKAEMKK